MDAGVTAAPPSVAVPSEGQSLEEQFAGSEVSVNSHFGVSPPQSRFFCWAVFQSVAFVLVYTGYNAAQGVLTVLLPESGTINLAIIYYCFGTSSILLAPLLQSRVNPKWLISLGFLFHVTWIAALFIGVAGLVYAASALVGIGLGLVGWCSGKNSRRTLTLSPAGVVQPGRVC